nr:MAG TPA: hypothetical protein [Caudoviricetes sp.]
MRYTYADLMLRPVCCREDGSIPSKGAFLLCHKKMIKF